MEWHATLTPPPAPPRKRGGVWGLFKHNGHKGSPSSSFEGLRDRRVKNPQSKFKNQSLSPRRAERSAVETPRCASTTLPSVAPLSAGEFSLTQRRGEHREKIFVRFVTWREIETPSMSFRAAARRVFTPSPFTGRGWGGVLFKTQRSQRFTKLFFICHFKPLRGEKSSRAPRFLPSVEMTFA